MERQWNSSSPSNQNLLYSLLSYFTSLHPRRRSVILGRNGWTWLARSALAGIGEVGLNSPRGVDSGGDGASGIGLPRSEGNRGGNRCWVAWLWTGQATPSAMSGFRPLFVLISKMISTFLWRSTRWKSWQTRTLKRGWYLLS